MEDLTKVRKKRQNDIKKQKIIVYKKIVNISDTIVKDIKTALPNVVYRGGLSIWLTVNVYDNSTLSISFDEHVYDLTISDSILDKDSLKKLALNTLSRLFIKSGLLCVNNDSIFIYASRKDMVSTEYNNSKPFGFFGYCTLFLLTTFMCISNLHDTFSNKVYYVLAVILLPISLIGVLNLIVYIHTILRLPDINVNK